MKSKRRRRTTCWNGLTPKEKEAVTDEWERLKLLEWELRGKLRPDGMLRYGPQFKRNLGRLRKMPVGNKHRRLDSDGS